MFRKRLLPIVAAAFLAAPAITLAEPGFQKGEFSLELSGQGSNGPDFDGTQFSVNAALGYYFVDNWNVSLTQTVGYNDIGGGGSDLNGSSSIGTEYHFRVSDEWYPYIGANIGYAYGDAVNDTFFASPEAGVKYFVNDGTYIFLSAEYQFFFDKGDDVDDNFSDGQFLYKLGIGFTFN